MKQVARILFFALLFAALPLRSLAAERIDEAPTFYQGYNIGECTVEVQGIGKVTATYLYYWDIAAGENLVADIMFVSYDLEAGYFGNIRQGRKTVAVEIFGSPGALYATRTCKV